MPKQCYVAVACDSKFARHNIMAWDQHKIEYWKENRRVRNNGIESGKNLACFQTFRTVAEGGVTLLT